MVQKPESDIEPKGRRIDLSLPQVAGSAVAAVAAAVAASQLGVYGTIAGAGVMSIVATCGGSVFQHFFRRTGEQIREVTVQVTHPGREVTVHTRRTTVRQQAPAGGEAPADETVLLGAVDDATTVLRRVDADETTVLRRVEGTTALPAPDATTVLRQVPDAPGADDAFSRATTHGTRVRGWKRSAIGAAAVFVVSMAGITTFELISGNDLSGGRGTTVGSVVRGENHAGPSTPAPSGTTDDPEHGAGPTDPARDDSTATPGTGGQDDEHGTTGPRQDRDDGSTQGPTPTPTPSDPEGSGVQPSPTPTPGTTDDGQDTTPGPAATDGAPAPGGTDAGE